MNPLSQLPTLWRQLWISVLLLAMQPTLLAVTVDQSFGYDALNRLTTVTGSGYSYDAAGNLLSITTQLPNLTPYKPNTWDDKIVVSRVTGTNTDSGSLTTADTLFLDWAVVNNGTVAAGAFYTELYVDGSLRETWVTPSLNPNTYTPVFDYPLGTLSAGTHMLRIKANSTAAVSESNDNDNEYTKTIVVAVPYYVLTTSAVPTAGGTTSGGGTFASGTSCTVTAVPNPGYAFVNWTEGGMQVSTAPSYSFTLTGNLALQANFTTILDTALSLDAPGQTFSAEGTTPWFGQSPVNRDGVDAVRSGFIGNSAVSSLTTTVTGPATVSFYWKVSSEANYDFLRVYVDDVDQGGAIHGAVDWTQRTLSIPAGSHTLRWTYAKDGSLFGGSDAGYVDQLVIQSQTPIAGWRQTYFGSSANTGDGADLNDYDNDGISNLLEYATGKNPKGSDTLPMAAEKAGNVIEFTYTKNKAAPDLTYVVEWSDTLANGGWSSAGVAEVILSDNGTTQQMKATLPAGSNGRRFVHLKVTVLP
jgi:YD repeat-containing protein